MVRSAMPRFYFHFKEAGYTHVDAVGHELPSLKEAEEEATVTVTAVLRDAAAKGDYSPVCVEVTNKAGFAVVTVEAIVKVERML